MQNMTAKQKMALLIVAVCVGALIARLLITPVPVRAQSEVSCGIFVEPGTTTIRTPDNSMQVLGKVMVNTCTGQIWGFPTTTNVPYPIDNTSSKPPVSRPVYLGKFEMTQILK